MSQKWFTSDMHFGHANIIKYCDRPFTDVDHMNEALITNWNSLVQPNDEIYVVGDVSFYKSAARTHAIISRLQGRKFLVRGNHDPKVHVPWFDEFEWVKDYAEIHAAKQKIILCHYAMRVWNGSHRGSWQLYGHSHGTLPDLPTALAVDVGVDCHNYFPISVTRLAEIMSKKTYAPVDNHGRR